MQSPSVIAARANLPLCPICDGPFKESQARTLYGADVCKKCCNGFANRRQTAWLIDIVGWFIAISFLFGVLDSAGLIAPTSNETPAETFFWQVVVWLVIPSLFGVKDGFRGQSPGKFLMGVQVVDIQTREPIDFAASFKRNLPLVIPLMPLVAAVQMTQGYRMGDKWAGTCVIRKKLRHRVPFDPRGILCTACGYNLTGNVSGRCPECGNDIPIRAVAPASHSMDHTIQH